ncbi:hypothetical protein [Sphingomonas trueperi]|uniref:hypothetical protein n=1 Tax=Sphingomonas trueperi TaxID=53317 RepID=UPI000EB1BD8E
MKINVTSIIRDHWATLYDAQSNRTNFVDVIVFYGAPIAAGAIAYFLSFKVKPEGYNVSITFFGIFLALLLNIQVAIFAIFQRKWDEPSDKRQADAQRMDLADRRKLLGELNSNISYLTIVSCIALIAFLIFYVAELKEGLWPAIAVVLYSHFILTFVMIVKRSHALFQKEYRDSPK